jgi:hypothetical protein
MQAWLSDTEHLPVPPPEKKYWWNIPKAGQPFADQFPVFDQFQRACYQWVEANRVILESLKNVPAKQQLFVRLEELTTSKEILINFLKFFDVEYDEHFYEYLQTPQNVIFPLDFPLTAKQNSQFNIIAADMMQKLGYPETKEYSVNYGNRPD